MNAAAGSPPDDHFSEEDWVDFAREQGDLEQIPKLETSWIASKRSEMHSPTEPYRSISKRRKS